MNYIICDRVEVLIHRRRQGVAGGHVIDPPDSANFLILTIENPKFRGFDPPHPGIQERPCLNMMF